MTDSNRMKKVYADLNVVAALDRPDQRPEENEAIRVLKAWSDGGCITLVVSAVHDREKAPPEKYSEERQRILGSLPKVEFADDHELLGFNTVYSGPGGTLGFVTSPLIADDAIARRLREIGLDRLDAHHVMLAIRRQCDAFATCDENTLLKYRTQIEKEYSIRLMLPSEFVRQKGKAPTA